MFQEPVSRKDDPSTLNRPTPLARLFTRLFPRDEDVWASFLILLLSIAVFSPSLWFVPTVSDDLKMLSSVARAESPLVFFTGDWGLGSDYYRPLSSLISWLLYHVFGVWAFPGRLGNLMLHSLNAWLLFRIIRRAQPNPSVALFAVSLWVVSIYTYSPAFFELERHTALVGLCLLLLFDRFSQGKGETVSPAYVALVSSIALMTKESGLVVPLYALYGSRNCLSSRRLRIAATSVAVVLVYAIVRISILGSNTVAPTSNGYLLGVYYYETWSQLPGYSKLIAFVDNVFKNSIAVFLPVFSDEGGILSVSRLVSRSPLWLPTILISGLSYRRRLESSQKSAISVIVLNALVHFALFRWRIHYVSQMALSVFVASSPHWLNYHGFSVVRAPSRATVFYLLAAGLLLFNVIWVGRSLSNEMVGRRERLLEISKLAERDPSIDKGVVEQILSRYMTPAWGPIQ